MNNRVRTATLNCEACPAAGREGGIAMRPLTVGVPKETASGELRVALVPDGVARLAAAGCEVLVQDGAGALAWFDNRAYAHAGADIVTVNELYRRADVVLTVGRPDTARLRPGQAVLVLGAGVAGLQAIGTARRLGAVVRAYDVRPAARGEVESLGASFVDLRSVADATGEGGYARPLTDEEQQAQ